jgi:hypothetical protein
MKLYMQYKFVELDRFSSTVQCLDNCKKIEKLPELKKTRAHNNLEWSDYDNGKEKKT